jgi:type VI secretion system protein ImpF
MSDLTPLEKLQPCLLDRLTDDEPLKQEESRSQRVISHQKYRRGVLRDLEWLFNSSALVELDPARAARLKDFPEVHRSVLNFGVRQLYGVTAVDLEHLQEELVQVIQIFEPRIVARTLRIRVDLERNLATFDLEGELWASPLPDHLHVKTTLDVETGQSLLGDSTNG